MTGSEYQKLAMRTENPECRVLTNVGLGLSGEAGECADIIKKHIHHGHDLDKEHLKTELGDVCWYIALGCELIGCSMDEIMRMNIEKLKARYPDGFDCEKPIHRIAGDV